MKNQIDITIYKVDGSIENKTVSQDIGLEYWQGLVGGLIEIMRVKHNGMMCDLIINEEGLLEGLQENPHSENLLVEAGFPNGCYLVGDLVLIHGRLR